MKKEEQITENKQLRQTPVSTRIITENTIENRILFNALYIGQNVFVNKNHVEKNPYELHSPTYCATEGWLQLKHLKDISDADALDAIRICKVYVRKDGAYITEFCPIENIKPTFLDVPIWRLDVADFLRSKGYALPFKQLSVEELLDYGWFRYEC